MLKEMVGIKNIATAWGDYFDAGGTMNGGAGNDILVGGSDSDSMTGGTGSDIFFFKTTLGPANVDLVNDFTSTVDHLHLDNTIFTALVTEGALSVDAFVSGAGAVATTAEQHIIYDTSTSNLYYDADGSGAGAAIQFATLSGSPSLASTDFLVI